MKPAKIKEGLDLGSDEAPGADLRAIGGGDGVGHDARYHKLDCPHSDTSQVAPVGALRARSGIKAGLCCHDI